MENGGMRCDVNVSLGTSGGRVEVKNLASIQSIQSAIEYEIERQKSLVINGESVKNETRGFNVMEGTTFVLRKKESTFDYRYMPEPDLPPLRLSDEFIEGCYESLITKDTRDYLLDHPYCLSELEARLIRTDEQMREFFESVVECLDSNISPSTAANWITTDLVGKIRSQGLSFEQKVITPFQAAKLLDARVSGRIGISTAKMILHRLATTDKGVDVDYLIQSSTAIQKL